jgi:hypothetical protein
MHGSKVILDGLRSTGVFFRRRRCGAPSLQAPLKALEALKPRGLVRLRRGLCLAGSFDPLAAAYSPSYISFETALMLWPHS